MIAHRSRYAGARRLLCIATALAALCSLGAAQADSGNEFATWENALEGLHDISGDFTVRNIGRSSIAGDDVRVRLSNLYGTQSITIVKATIGLQVIRPSPPCSTTRCASSRSTGGGVGDNRGRRVRLQ